MKDCIAYHSLISRAQTGELHDDARMALQGHCRECPDCAALMQSHDQLRDLHAIAPEMTAAESVQLRRAVMDRLPRAGAPKSSLWQDLREFLGRHPLAAAPVVGVALLAVFLLGRWSVPSADTGNGTLLAQLNRQATARQSVEEFLDNPLTYSNVSVRPRGNRLALSFDVRRHVEMEAGLESPLARDVLLASLLDDASTGSRMRAIQLAPFLHDDSLREALVYTLANDPDPAVRLETIDALTRCQDAPTIDQALLKALSEDTSVNIRLVALDHLTRRQVDPARIQQAISTTEAGGQAAVLQQAIQWQRRES